MRSGDKSGENHVANSVAFDLNVFGVLMKGGVICDEDGSVRVTVHRHIPFYWKTKIMK